MKKYQFYIYAKLKTGTFARLIFLVDDNDEEQFVRAETKESVISEQKTKSQYEAICFVRDNKLRLIDEFQTRL